ncbi:TetR/AcrR family transcriptional regulator [Blastococcus sp. PRF04-17]|uniref:TetR/AcrR family transcriptional regulator n=1 Tax=Blastococcus sp. PRF04-17 TaxID=2933797 RepID=UPI001FF18681|nr:TetR/AcrR family transcriptional regulator [Blastococcus sp. PRF04-17]UOY01946.1 TetR/AcrR family transcriptional regulator [Blastococcus sp. PRF04-17]
MAIPSSPEASRIERRRAGVMEEALDHAVALMAAEGVGALSVNEVARRMGIRGPSLYKYFPSRHAIYDALFLRGLRAQQAAVAAAVEGLPPGVAQLRAGGAAVVRWAVANPALAQLLHWRPVPGFEPSPEAFAPSRDDMVLVRSAFAAAVRAGHLSPAASTDDAVRLWTVLLSGLISQQLANQPGVPFEEGAFSRLTGTAIDQFLSAYTP